ncbi:FTM-like protein, partial [Mya arenaria]
MTDVDHIPVKDTNVGGLEQRAAQQRRMVSKWDRGELEDKYLRMAEENLILKKHARKQEDKIKRMATKLLRLVNDKKKTGDVEISHVPGGKKIRDIEMEEKMAELQDKILNLEKNNHHLKEKVWSCEPRPPETQSRRSQWGPGGYTHGKQQTRQVAQQHEQINMYELEMRQLREQVHVKEREYEEDLTKIKHQITAEHRTNVQENIDMIKLQREVKEKSTNAFDLEREREWRQRENALKVQIAQLEATLKADLGEKGGILDKLAIEKDQYDRMTSEHRTMQLEHFQLREKYDDLESAVDFTEIEEALVLVKQKKQKLTAHPEFLHRVDEELDKDAQRRLLDLQAEYAETVALATGRMDEVKKEYEMRLDEYARLLDMRQARIKKLESQLRDVAYGTKQYKIMPPADDMDEDVEQFDETIHLERGQNLFEIHVTKATLSSDALRLLGDEEPSLFCTWEFFEYEIQSTPVVRGGRPEFDFTSQYIVKVDDFFLHYLQKESCTLELHQSFGQDYTTIAACQITFRELFDKTHGRIHGTATLTGVMASGTGIGFGTIEYWVRLRVPMDQALRLYKERTKALGYMTTNIRASDQALQALDDEAARRPPDNVNELHIKVVRCSSLKARRENVQPSPYCVYQFFDYNDHDTVIINSSNNPEFNDHKTYPVPMTADLDQYLKTMPLKIFIFDDTDPEQTSYLGIADIPLIPLAHDKGVSGIFELRGANGHINGTVEVELRWQFTYMPPSAMKTGSQRPHELEAAPQEPPEKLVAFQDTSSMQEQPRVGKRMAPQFPGPSAHSTPAAKPRDHMEDREHRQPKQPTRRQLIQEPSSETEEDIAQPSAIQRDSMVHEAVSHAVSTLMPGLDTMTTLNETIETPERSVEEPVRSPSPTPEEAPIIEEEEDIVSDRGSVRSVRSQASSVRSQASSVRSQASSVHSKANSLGSQASRESQSENVSPSASQGGTLREEEAPPTESESETPPIESDSEGVMVAPKPSKRKQKPESKPGNSVTVAINRVSLEEDSAAMANDHIKQLFVEYKFLGIDPQETETPFSLPKPKPYHNIQIRFTLVSEPPEDDQDGDCEDVGVACVNVRDILTKRRDLEDQDVDIMDIETEQTVIGSMNLTVQCLAALDSVEKEMKDYIVFFISLLKCLQTTVQ